MDSDNLPELRGSSDIERGDRVDLLQTYLLRFERDQTRRNYRNDIVQFFGTDDITIDHARAISFVDVNQHLADLEAEQYKPSSIKRRIARSEERRVGKECRSRGWEHHERKEE